jgi:hypothetical protein
MAPSFSTAPSSVEYHASRRGAIQKRVVLIRDEVQVFPGQKNNPVSTITALIITSRCSFASHQRLRWGPSSALKHFLLTSSSAAHFSETIFISSCSRMATAGHLTA